MAAAILKISDTKSISGNVDTDYIERLIEDAERKSLIPLLNSRFYQAVRKNVEDGGTAYDDLLNEKEYTVNGEQYHHLGLKRVIEDYFMAEYVVRGDVLITPGGMQVMAEPMSSASKEILRKSYLETASLNWKQIEHYLNANATTFPLWDCHSKQPPVGRSRTRFTKVDT